eukprot:2967459-Amphidinium_carterae.1
MSTFIRYRRIISFVIAVTWVLCSFEGVMQLCDLSTILVSKPRALPRSSSLPLQPDDRVVYWNGMLRYYARERHSRWMNGDLQPHVVSTESAAIAFLRGSNLLSKW